MKQIQLYIEDQRVELYKDESIVLTQTVQNVKDIGKVFTPFSRSFTVPASRTNNKIFKHFYNSSIIDAIDVRVRVDARIDLNHSRFEKGKIKLDGVQMKNNKADSYKITFFGNTVTLRDKLRNDKLDALYWLKNFNFSYSNTAVINALSTGKDVSIDGVNHPDAFVVPLITHEDRLFYDPGSPEDKNLAYNSQTVGGVDWQQLKPAIRIDHIIRAIEKQYDIEFSDHFFNADNPAYWDLYMWLHRKKGQINESAQGVDTYIDAFNFEYQTWGNGFMTNPYGYTMRNITSVPTYSGYQDNFDEYDWSQQPPTSVNYYTVRHYFVPNDPTLKYTIVIKIDGRLIERIEDVEGSKLVQIAHRENGNVTVEVEANQTMSFLPTRISVIAEQHYGVTKWKVFDSQSLTLAPDFTFDSTREIPEIKVVDFLSGLFKMWNLVAYVDYDGKIIVRTLDSWYQSSDNTFDITEHIDSTKSTIDTALPYREILFDYEGKQSFFAKNHNALFNYEHGVERYRGDDNKLLSGADYRIKIPFEHHKFERLYNPSSGTATDIQWGWSVDDNMQSILGKPLLFYPIQQSNSTPIAVKSTPAAHQSVSTYYIPSNSLSLDPNVSSENLNFKAEINEYTATTFDQTLFKKYYSKYISETFDQSRRLTKFTARLPMSFLLNYELNDLVIVFSRLYTINSIETNLSSGISKLELINSPESQINAADDTLLYTNVDSDLGTSDSDDVTVDTDDEYTPDIVGTTTQAPTTTTTTITQTSTTSTINQTSTTSTTTSSGSGGGGAGGGGEKLNEE